MSRVILPVALLALLATAVSAAGADERPLQIDLGAANNSSVFPTANTDPPRPTGSAAYTGWVPAFGGQSKVSLDLFGGIQFDTDANQATEATIPGQVGQTVVPSTLRKQSDWSFITKANASHSYTPRTARGVTWETNAALTDQRFFRLSHNFDLTTAEINTGPRFDAGRIGQVGLSVRPYGSYTWIGYGEETYAMLYGGGVSAEAHGTGWATRLLGQSRFGSYADSSFRPMIRPFTGPEWLTSLSALFLAGRWGTITPSVSWFEADGRSGAFSRRGPAGSIAFEKQLSLWSRSAVLTASGSAQQLTYGGPPPGSQGTAARNDTLVIADLLINIPIYHAPLPAGPRSLRVVSEYQYLNNQSNYLPFENHSFSVGIRLSL